MKEGWTYKKLGEVCDILNGYAFKSNKYTIEGVRVIRITNVQKGYIEDSDPKFYPIETQKELARYLLKDGDLLLSLTGNVGRVAIISKYYLPAYLNQRVACIRTKDSSSLDLNFLFHLLYSKKFEEDCIQSSTGAAQLNMSTVWLASYSIPLPSLSEQQQIVSYLDSSFAHIDELKANAEKQLNDAKALFQKALGKAMEPKEGWEEKLLKELTSEIGDGLHGTPKYSDDGRYYFVNGNNLENGIIEIKGNTKRVGLEEYEKYKIDLNSSTVLLSINGTIGKTAFYEGEPIILGKSACYINVLPTLLKEFLRYFLLSGVFVNYANRNSRQATIINLGLKEIRNMPIPLPPLSEQQQIVTRLDNLSANIKALEENLEKTISECDALKQALLREVFAA